MKYKTKTFVFGALWTGNCGRGPGTCSCPLTTQLRDLPPPPPVNLTPVPACPPPEAISACLEQAHQHLMESWRCRAPAPQTLGSQNLPPREGKQATKSERGLCCCLISFKPHWFSAWVRVLVLILMVDFAGPALSLSGVCSLEAQSWWEGGML